MLNNHRFRFGVLNNVSFFSLVGDVYLDTWEFPTWDGYRWTGAAFLIINFLLVVVYSTFALRNLTRSYRFAAGTIRVKDAEDDIADLESQHLIVQVEPPAGDVGRTSIDQGIDKICLQLLRRTACSVLPR